MKKRICFAGFDEKEISALQPEQSAWADSWECVFTPGTASALELMAKAPFDALICNLAAGGIGDSELLHQTAVRYPRTLRFILGDLADRELIVNCIGASHQFVSRPWLPKALISIIERSLALDQWLCSDKLRAFASRLGVLPGLPSSYFEILRICESSQVGVDRIAEVIARDPTLTARLLQMVNSPACATGDKITNPCEAVSRMGVENIKAMVLCLQLFNKSAGTELPGLSLDQLWRHSFKVAKLAKEIAHHFEAEESTASGAYTAGLLHNIGRIVLATNLASEYPQILEIARRQKLSLQQAELQHLGVTSNQVGTYLLSLWGMPLPLLEATAHYHSPRSSGSAEISILTAVHAANVLAHEDEPAAKGVLPPTLDADYLATLKLPTKTTAWRKMLASKAVKPKNPENRPPAKPAALPKETPGRPFGKFAFAAIIAFLAVTAIALKIHPLRVSARNQAPASAESSADADSTDADTVFTPITFQGIIYRVGHPAVLLNGRSVEVGQSIDGAKVVLITPSNTVLICKGVKKTYSSK